MRGLTRGRSVTLRDRAEFRASVRFTPPGGLSEAQAKQAMMAAAELLAAQRIEDPTLEEVRAALVGGAVTTLSGRKLLLHGVLDADGQ